MIMKMRFYLCVFLCVFALPAYAGGDDFVPETEFLAIVTEKGAQHDFVVEVARTPPEWKYGLMYRTEMPENHGMLFSFPQEQMRSFWMKNTFISLDMIFIDSKGKVVSIQEKAEPLSLEPRPSEGPARAVLEINGGVSGKLGIKAGDTVHHEIFGNALIHEEGNNKLAE